MPVWAKVKALVLGGWPLLAWAVAFGIAHTQAPLYYSNQNQYFLHGLASGGLGLLDEDWLANTHDPTPVFSAAVAFTYRYLGVDFFYVYYFIVLAVYFGSLAAIAAVPPGPGLSGLARFGFLTLLVTVHAAILRVVSVCVVSVDCPWYLQTGVANQYVLGPGLQPSVFGVLLIVSVVTFARGRPFLAASCASVAAIVHATYLLPAALFILTYMAVLTWSGRWKAGLVLGIGSLCAVLPVVIYSVRMFAPSSAEQFAEAQQILAEFRIPHHAKVGQWLDAIAVGQLLWIGLAVLCVRGTTLFPVLTFPALGGLALSLVQVATGSHTLALLFPWRISAVLMPVATAVLLVWLVGAVGPWLSRRQPASRYCLWRGCAELLAAAVAGGVLVSCYGLGYRTDDGELPMMAHVWEHKLPGDVYLLPVGVPSKAPAPGSVSTTFKSPPSAAQGLIPVDLQRFRLFAGAPIYVDFKSIPYKDTEVLEWYQRILRCQDWSKRKDWDGSAMRGELSRARITHVLTKADHTIDCAALKLIFADNRYRIYRLRTPPGRGTKAPP